MNISAYLDNVAKPFMNLVHGIKAFTWTSFILHGLGKFPMPADGMVKLFESKGILFPELTASLVALGEVGAGAAVIIGGFLGATGHLVTRLGGGAVAVIMIGALLIAHPDWLITQKLFMSEQIFLLAMVTNFAKRRNK